MPKIPDRKMWDARTKSYMSFPGIPPLNIEVGRTYEIAWIDYDDLGEASFQTPYTIVAVKTFKTVGRRWTIISENMRHRAAGTSFLYDHEILEQTGRRLVVGMPWNYAKFNPDYADLVERKREIFLKSKTRSRAADENRYAKNDEFAAAGFVE